MDVMWIFTIWLEMYFYFNFWFFPSMYVSTLILFLINVAFIRTWKKQVYSEQNWSNSAVTSCGMSARVSISTSNLFLLWILGIFKDEKSFALGLWAPYVSINIELVSLTIEFYSHRANALSNGIRARTCSCTPSRQDLIIFSFISDENIIQSNLTL